MVNIFLLIMVAVSGVRMLGDRGLEIEFSMDSVVVDYGFSDAVWLSRAGEPNVPSVVYRIGIPQGGDVEMVVSERREEVIDGVRIEPVRDVGILEPPYPAQVEVYGDVYNEARFFPYQEIEVTKPGYLRDLNVVEVRLNPVQYNCVTGELRLVRLIRFEVRFIGRPQERAVIDESFEEIYRRLLVNYEQCCFWRREPLRDGWDPFFGGAWYKIEVSEEGLYRIGYDEIRAAGLDPGQFNPRTMKVYTAAFDLLPRNVVDPFADSLIEIPVYVAGEGDGRFDRDDYLIFYGYPASHFVPDSVLGWYDNGYARENVYWFTFGGANGVRMERVDVAPSGVEPDSVVREIVHIEEDVGNPTRSGVNWYWRDISPGEGSMGSGSVVLRHPRAAGNVQITIGLFNWPTLEFVYKFSLDGDIYFSDTLTLPSRDTWPPNYLTGNTLVSGDSSELLMEIIRPASTLDDLFTVYFNGIDLQYERETDIDEPFHAVYQAAQAYSIKCTDIGTQPFVFDITDMKAPKMFYNYQLDHGSLILSSRSDSFQLLYFSKLALARSVELESCDPGRLRAPSEGCEYLFITHRDFYSAIMPLVNYRRQDYTTRVVIIDDIYDDFSFGKYDPLAIKHFLYYTTNNWTTVPTFVLLVGDATYDYKNNLGKENSPNFIPLYENGSCLSGNPGIPPNYIYEGEYVNFGAGEVMVLGRITVRTRQEVRDFIDKVFTYETGNIDGMWNKRIILAADDEYSNTYKWEDPRIYHTAACERIIRNIPDSLYDLAKVYMISYPPFSYPAKKPNAQEAYIRELNKGCFAGVFYGHGNTHQLADEGLFFDYSIPRIKNSRQYFFFYYGSCTVSRFDDSDYECIGEQMVRMKQGAIGTMGETGGSSASGNSLIGDTLFKYMTTTDLTMGECFLIAKHGEYLLLGDPATRLRRPNDTIQIAALPESLRPLEKLKVTTDEEQYYLKAFVRDTTHIEKFDATTADKIPGHIYRMVQISGGSNPQFIPYDYNIEGKDFYEGYWDEDTAVIIAPRVYSTLHLPVMKVSSCIGTHSGWRDSVRLYGTYVPSADTVSPEVYFYDGGRRLKDGDWVDQEFTLTGKVSDESGINLLNSVEDMRGFYLYVNNDFENKVDLRDYFMYDKNSYIGGEFNTDLVLTEPVDTVTVNVVDNYYNQTIASVVLNAEVYGRVGIEDFLIYPNPLQDERGLWFTFTLTGSGVVDIKVFTVAGRLIKTIEHRVCQAGYNQIYWDVFDEHHDRISNGVYLVKAYVSANNASDAVIEKFIIAR